VGVRGGKVRRSKGLGRRRGNMAEWFISVPRPRHRGGIDSCLGRRERCAEHWFKAGGVFGGKLSGKEGEKGEKKIEDHSPP
jgi:hypothetical protein